MKPRTYLTVIFLANALLSYTLKAETPTEKAIQRHQQLWKYMSETLLSARSDPNATFLMLPLGIPADLGIDTKTPAGAAALWALLDAKIFGGDMGDLPVGNITAQASVGKTYTNFIKSHIRKNPPPQDLVTKLEQVEDKIDAGSTAYYAAYIGFEDKASAAVVAYLQGTISMEKMTERVGKLKSLLAANKAYRDVQNLIDQATKLRHQISDGMWSVRREDAENANSANFPSITYPDYSKWSDDTGWVEHTINASDWSKVDSHSSFSASASGGFLWFKASGNYSKVQDHSDEALDKLVITFKAKRVVIMRRWLDQEAFGDSTFNMDPQGPPLSLLSTGKIDPSSGAYGTANGEGSLPLITTDIVLVKDVELKSDWEKKTLDYVKEQAGGSGGFSFGPFKIGGGGNRSWDTTTSTAKIASGKISIPTPLIVGYICYKVPQCPRPTSIPSPTP